MGNVTLETIGPERAEAALDLLEEFHSEHMTRAQWSRLFTHDWRQPERHCGVGLVDGKAVVGFLGFFFSTRQVAGQSHRFCNLTGWIVRESHRNHSLTLLAPLLKMKDYTITNFSSYPEGVRIMKRFGFRDLDTRSFLIPCVPGLSGGWRCVDRPSEVAALADGQGRQILADHAGYTCRSVVLVSPEGARCHAVFSPRVQRGLRYWYLNYASDARVLAAGLAAIRSHLLLRHGVALMLVDERFVSGARLPFHFARTLSAPRLYKPASELLPAAVDSLYSEWVVFR